jgi:hypothetical protein
MELNIGWVKKVWPGTREIRIAQECRDQDGNFQGVDTGYYRDCPKDILDYAKPLVGKRVITATEVMESGTSAIIAMDRI